MSSSEAEILNNLFPLLEICKYFSADFKQLLKWQRGEFKFTFNARVLKQNISRFYVVHLKKSYTEVLLTSAI